MNIIINEGIAHINDLKIDKFLDTVRKLANKDKSLELSVKFDGSANLGFGLDDNGRLYFSRDVKGQPEHKTSPDDWPKKPMYNAIRTAVAAISKGKNIIEKSMKPGDYIGTEVLFEAIPNAIEYGDNFVIIHDAEYNYLVNKLKSLSAKIDVYFYNHETKKVEKENRTVTYKFSGKEILRSNKFKISIGGDIKKLEAYLKNKNRIFKDMSNYDILSMRAVGKDKEAIKKERERVKSDISKMQLQIKDKLIDQILNKISAGTMTKPPEFDDKGNNIGGSWPEGVVIKDLKTGELSKIVSVFPLINQFLWYYRAMATGGAGEANSYVFGVLATFKNEIAENVFRIKGLKSPGITKNINKKYKGFVANEKLLRFLSDQGFNFKQHGQAKTKFINSEKKALKELNKLEKEFEKIGIKKTLNVRQGTFKRNIKHDPIHIRKTRETFLDVKEELTDYIKEISRISESTPEGNSVQLLRIFLGQKNLQKLNEDYQLIKEIRNTIRKRILKEGPKNMKVGIIVGRFQPPTSGHIKVISKALKENDKVYVFVAGQKKDLSNPIPYQMRSNILKKFIKNKNVQIFPIKTGYIPNLIEQFIDMTNITHVNMYAGSDRIPEYIKQFKGKWNYQNVTYKINEIPRSGRAVSGTKVRETIKSGDLDRFIKSMPKNLSYDDNKRIFKQYQKYIKNENVNIFQIIRKIIEHKMKLEEF